VLQVDDRAAAAIRDRVIGELVAFNDVAAGVADHRELSVIARDQGEVVGGLFGYTNWDWLFIAQLWVSDTVRRRGIGQRLVRESELEARRRGCRHAHVDTFSFQALSFYERLGYAVVGRLDDYPAGHARYFLQKSELLDQ
jgi:predicted N-acetyltransferase YhbS